MFLYLFNWLCIINLFDLIFVEMFEGVDIVFLLRIFNYCFSFDCEIVGFIYYINIKLVLLGKCVKVLLWSGNG